MRVTRLWCALMLIQNKQKTQTINNELASTKSTGMEVLAEQNRKEKTQQSSLPYTGRALWLEVTLCTWEHPSMHPSKYPSPHWSGISTQVCILTARGEPRKKLRPSPVSFHRSVPVDVDASNSGVGRSRQVRGDSVGAGVMREGHISTAGECVETGRAEQTEHTQLQRFLSLSQVVKDVNNIKWFNLVICVHNMTHIWQKLACVDFMLITAQVYTTNILYNGLGRLNMLQQLTHEAQRPQILVR